MRLLLLALLLCLPLTLPAKHSTHAKSAAAHSHPSSVHSPKHPSKRRCATCPRNKHGKIKRSAKAKHDFMKRSGYPKGRKGYVVDHIVPLKKGGCDCPANMQWQTVEEGKAKDKTE
jgi:hypothetical protein